jgi:hypothetical protein
MHYQGLRTSFSLHRSNAARHPGTGWTLGAAVRFSYDLLDRRRTLLLQPLNSLGSKGESQWNEFQRLFSYWNKTNLDLKGSPVFPPVMANLEFVRRQERKALLMCFASAILLAPTIMLVLSQSVASIVWLIWLGFMAFCWSYTWRSVRALRELNAISQRTLASKDPVRSPSLSATVQPSTEVEVVRGSPK